jgi:hypothetical protein
MLTKNANKKKLNNCKIRINEKPTNDYKFLHSWNKLPSSKISIPPNIRAGPPFPANPARYFAQTFHAKKPNKPAGMAYPLHLPKLPKPYCKKTNLHNPPPPPPYIPPKLSNMRQKIPRKIKQT